MHWAMDNGMRATQGVDFWRKAPVEIIQQLLDFVLHFDDYLADVIARYGVWTLAFLFAIIFMETGLVVTPFLPGDSLIFAASAFAARGALNPWAVFVLLSIAAILGDTVNYWIGRRFGEAVLARERLFLIRRAHLVRTEEFFARHGGKAVVLARFAPIVRTFAPFVAGAGRMSYPKFMAYNVSGGIAWVLICTCAGYLFGNLPFVRENFSLVALGIVFVSVLPMGIEMIRTWFPKERKAKPVELAATAEQRPADGGARGGLS